MNVSPAEFRRDRRLRSSHHHLATAALAALAASAPLVGEAVGRAWNPREALAFVASIAALASLVPAATERRLAKIAGPAGQPGDGSSRSGHRGGFVTFCVAAAPAAAAFGATTALGRLALVLSGAVLLRVWPGAQRVPAYRRLAPSLASIAAALAAAEIYGYARTALILWGAALGAALAAAVAVERRLLWSFRAEDDARVVKVSRGG